MENERLYHERHAKPVAERFNRKNILNTLVGDLGLVGDVEEVDYDAGGVAAERLFDGFGDNAGEKCARELIAIDVGDVGAEHEGGLWPDWQGLEVLGLAECELDGVRRSGHQRGDSRGEVFDAGQERSFVEEAVVDSDIETAAGLWVEKAV